MEIHKIPAVQIMSYHTFQRLANKAKELFTFCRGSKVAGGLADQLFEEYAHKRLMKGGTFKLRYLVASKPKELNWVHILSISLRHATDALLDRGDARCEAQM